MLEFIIFILSNCPTSHAYTFRVEKGVLKTGKDDAGRLFSNGVKPAL